MLVEIEDVTESQVEALARLATALHSVASIVLPNPMQAGAGMFGCALEILVENGCSEAQAVEQVHSWFANHDDIRARVARLAIKLVQEEPPND